MSDDNNTPEIELDGPSELELLKDRAKKMGISVKGNVSVETLRERIEEQLSPKKTQDSVATPVAAQSEVPSVTPRIKSKAEIRREKHKEMNKLVRVEISSMNPGKRAWPGEIFTCGNSELGMFKKFVPFGVPFHVPQMVLNMIEERECSVFVNAPGNMGNKTKQRRTIKEFNIRYLDPISNGEYQEIRERQIAQGNT
jgi:hypothetical protein